jgi:hypothetical protein
MARRWQDWVSLIVGAWLVASPWVLGFSSETTILWTMAGVGAAVVLVAVWALAAPDAQYPEWCNAALGAGLFLAPWTLTFTDEGGASWNAWIFGFLIAALAVWALFDIRIAKGVSAGRRRPAH